MRDFPDFIETVDHEDKEIYRLMVCNGRDDPFPLQAEEFYRESSKATHSASEAVFNTAHKHNMRADDNRIYYWRSREDALIARAIARFAVGR